MAIWLTRAGKHGEFEQRFLDEHRIYLNWDKLNQDLGGLTTKEELAKVLREVYPESSAGRLRAHLGQIWIFAKRMQVGDWVAMPSKLKPAVHIAEITGAYQFEAKEEGLFQHFRSVKWIETDIPRSNFDQDLLYTLGAFLTICQIQRNDAEARIKAMAKNGWKSTGWHKNTPTLDDPVAGDIGGDDESESFDLEQLARDRIAKLITSHYKGHAMAVLVEAALNAQGYTTHRSPEGPDKGIDILAAQGALGFGQPRIAVQVKSADAPVDRPTLDQLIGAMQNVHADQGLLVSWGGFKTSVDKEKAAQFFRVRLWDQDILIDQILANYDKLSDDLRAELPLKRIWTVAESDELISET